jgi:N-acetylmuramoyl-L-alanine amidase
MNMGVVMGPTGTRWNAKLAKTAKKHLLSVLCGLCVLISTPATAAPTVRAMYTDAMAREQALREALNDPAVPVAVLAEIRATVAAYEALVRRYPASSYDDNALWQAGRLSLDAFARFGQDADKQTGIRILKKLAASYPSSKLARQVPQQITRAESAGLAPRQAQVERVPASPPIPRQAPDEPAPPSPPIPRPAQDARVSASPVIVSPSKDEHRSASRLAVIKGIRRVVLPDAVRITIELDTEVPFHDERIPDPARVFVDLPGTRPAAPLVDQTLRFQGDADIVRQVRIGRHPNNTTRVVLDAAGVTSYSVYPLYSPYRLVIDCVRMPAQTAAAAMTDKVLARVPPPEALPIPVPPARAAVPQLLSARTMTTPWLRRLPGRTPIAAALIASARRATESIAAIEPEATNAPAAVDAPLPSLAAPVRQSAPPTTDPPANNATGGLSMARQLGLGVSRIVIDPGHGGHDPGAKGKGVAEAELVLDVALRLEKLLQKVPGVEVILTRRTDDFIPLPERTAIANREGADLFLSIHANASTSAQAHGIETYFLNFANNQSAAAVAARENAASTQSMGGLPDFVKAIALNNKLDESRDFALHVQRAMVERQKTANKLLKDLGVKQAPFVVLIGANMPSVLAETGFVTNAQEAKLLKANAYRQKIAESLFNAIRKYQMSLKNISTIAHQ